MIKTLASQIPLTTRWSTIVCIAIYLLIFNPLFSICELLLTSLTATEFSKSIPTIVAYLNYSLIFLTFTSIPIFVSKLIWPELSMTTKKKKRPVREMKIGEMIFTEKDLFTNIMITGAIGSGKTSSAIYPMLSQLFEIYNTEDADTDIDDPWLKLGGLIMDVKGDFYETLIYKMYQTGRDIFHDLIVITPWSEYHFVEFVDERGFYFYISARGGGDDSSNELYALLCKRNASGKIRPAKFLPNPETLAPDPKHPIPINLILSKRDRESRIRPDNPLTYDQYLKSLSIDIADVPEPPKFLGWRWSGNKLKRISYSIKQDNEIDLLENSKAITIDPPKTLKFNKVLSVNNGLTFNICPPSLSPAELANRLVAMSRSASGKGGGDNAFWDDATKKHIGWVVLLRRELYPDKEVTAIDINRLTGDQNAIDQEVDLLDEYIHKKRKEQELLSDLERPRMNDEISILETMKSYFTEEWKSLDQKTKSNLVACITNLFGQFMSDPKLRSCFCVSSSVKLDEIMNSGKIFTLVAQEYESAARVFGTSLKMEFQALLRRRTSQAHYNKMRFVLFMCDEAQNYVTAGGADNTGDENFMALSRQSRVCNIIATQSDSSITNVIGDKSAPVYYQSFGGRIWFQNLDAKTNKSATELLGEVKKDKETRQGKDINLIKLFDKEGGGSSVSTSEERVKRYPTETFTTLDLHECVVYNKGRKGHKDKAGRWKLSPDPIGSDAEQAKKAKVIRYYFQGYIENRLYNLGQSAVLNHIKDSKPKQELEQKTTTETSSPVVPPVVIPNENLTHNTENPTNTDDFIVPNNPTIEELDLDSPKATDIDLLGINKAIFERDSHYTDKTETREPIPTSTAPDTHELAKPHFKFMEHAAEEDITQEEADEIRSKFGDATAIGLKLGKFVGVMDQTARINSEFEDDLYSTSWKTTKSDAMVGNNGKFLPSDTFEQERNEFSADDAPEAVNLPSVDEQDVSKYLKK